VRKILAALTFLSLLAALIAGQDAVAQNAGQRVRKNIDTLTKEEMGNYLHAILNRPQSSDPVPPKDEASPRPQEWIDLFSRWVAVGENEFNGTPPRLLIGQCESFQLASGFGRWRLTGTAMVKTSPTLQEVIVISANAATTLPRQGPGA
jgi:hypothetical protein